MATSKIKSTVLAIATVMALSVAGTASALNYGTVIANEVGPGSPIGGTVSGSLNSGGSFSNGGGGLFLFDRVGGTAPDILLPNSPKDRFTGFCLEFNESLNGGNNTYDLVDLFQAPVDAVGTIVGGMGIPKSNLIASILGNVFPLGAPSTTTADIGLGVQIAIWEIVHETSGSYALGAGTARWTTTNAAALANATTYLANIGLGGDWLGDFTAVGLKLKAIVSQSTRDNDQDFLVWSDSDASQEVPLPAAAWLLISGLAGLGAVARRRKSA